MHTVDSHITDTGRLQQEGEVLSEVLEAPTQPIEAGSAAAEHAFPQPSGSSLPATGPAQLLSMGDCSLSIVPPPGLKSVADILPNSVARQPQPVAEGPPDKTEAERESIDQN